jgi:hypothetical protein
MWGLIVQKPTLDGRTGGPSSPVIQRITGDRRCRIDQLIVEAKGTQHHLARSG